MKEFQTRKTNLKPFTTPEHLKLLGIEICQDCGKAMSMDNKICYGCGFDNDDLILYEQIITKEN